MATFSDEQFQLLLATLKGNSGNTEATNPINVPQKNDPAALGPIRMCDLGSNKMLKLTKFEDWLEEAENRMDYIGVQDDKSKIILLKSWGGAELMDFIKTHVKIKYEETPANTQAVPPVEAVPADTYAMAVKKIKDQLRTLVNRTMAMHDLLTTKQGSRNWMDFIHDLEKKAKILGFDKQPYTQQDAVKDAAIFGMTDARLREKALAEDPTLDTLTRWGHAREAGKEDAVNLKDASSGAIKRIGWRESNPPEEMDDEELDNLIDSLNVMKLKKAGKYSVRFKNKDSSSCNRCLTDHPQGRCPAFGKECFTCGEKNHFSRAAICKGKSVKRITEDTETKPYSDTQMKTNTSHLNNERPTEQHGKSNNQEDT